jgi:DNA-binding PadR family transcriptional regulator
MKVPLDDLYDFFEYNRRAMNTDPYELLPLRPVAYQVLLALADGERHGYGIVQDISQRTAARMSLEPGNLYRTLKWMLDQQLIEESDRRPAPDLDDERRRYYRITRFGWRVGVAETSRLEALVAEAKTKRWSPR